MYRHSLFWQWDVKKQDIPKGCLPVCAVGVIHCTLWKKQNKKLSIGITLSKPASHVPFMKQFFSSLSKSRLFRSTPVRWISAGQQLLNRGVKDERCAIGWVIIEAMSASSWTKCQRLSHGPRTIAVCFCLLSRFLADKPVNTKPRLSACFYCQGLHRNQKKRSKILFDLLKNHLSYPRFREAEGQSWERESRGSSHVECTFPTGLIAAFLVPAELDWKEAWADVRRI